MDEVHHKTSKHDTEIHFKPYECHVRQFSISICIIYSRYDRCIRSLRPILMNNYHQLPTDRGILFTAKPSLGSRLASSLIGNRPSVCVWQVLRALMRRMAYTRSLI